MPPPGGCTPIGLTVSGEIVFPFQCKDFIDRMKASNQRPPSADKSAGADDQPSPAAQRFPVAEDRSTSDDKSAVADEKPMVPPEQPAAADPNPAPAEPKPAVVEEKPAAPAAEPKPVAAEEKPAAAEQKPVAAQEKPLVDAPQSAAVEESISLIKPGEKIPLPRRAAERPKEPKEFKMTALCTRFRSYNATAGTYKGFDGRVRPCR